MVGPNACLPFPPFFLRCDSMTAQVRTQREKVDLLREIDSGIVPLFFFLPLFPPFFPFFLLLVVVLPRQKGLGRSSIKWKR